MCSSCRLTKASTEFYTNKTAADMLHSLCKTCHGDKCRSRASGNYEVSVVDKVSLSFPSHCDEHLFATSSPFSDILCCIFPATACARQLLSQLALQLKTAHELLLFRQSMSACGSIFITKAVTTCCKCNFLIAVCCFLLWLCFRDWTVVFAALPGVWPGEAI